ncbi:MAG: hypothetical protein H6593_05765 [Flavobacteriales bacterium]|nr:hypothetical protein [Flavobacteriales bacterium]
MVDGQLHLHGAFNTVDGQPISNWAVYDGTTWQQVDTTEEFGFNTAKAVRYQGDLYVAGNFNTSNGVNDLARQGPNGWEALGPGLLGDPWVNEMVVYDGLLWVTGEFYEWWGNAASGIMAWDGSQWHNMFPDIFPVAKAATWTWPTASCISAASSTPVGRTGCTDMGSMMVPAYASSEDPMCTGDPG